jgi:glycosyltransferase involved in cell wall biosynthesis
MTQPMVSVRVVTYNHARFIAICLESILAQRTDFPFEIIVGEDCSTDGTRAIVDDYGRRFPELIRVITSETNGGGYANNVRVRQACRGSYHAFCEGDDFWIDPLKLQKQVMFLEAHPDYSLCFHDAIRITDGKAAYPRYFCPNDLPVSLTVADVLLRPCFIPTGSILMRRAVAETRPETSRPVWCSDLLTRLWSAHLGKLGYLDDLMSVRRALTTGLSKSTPIDPLYQDTLFVFEEFDRATAYRYTDVIRQGIQRVQTEYADARLRRRCGNWYLLARPGKLLRHLRDFAQRAGR